MLTMDSEFQRNRARGKLRTANNFKEGLIAGGRELGSNIVQGITGELVAVPLSNRQYYYYIINTLYCKSLNN